MHVKTASSTRLDRVERLWAIRTPNGRRLWCELNSPGADVWDVEIFTELEFLYRRRWSTRLEALMEADALRDHYLARPGACDARRSEPEAGGRCDNHAAGRTPRNMVG